MRVPMKKTINKQRSTSFLQAIQSGLRCALLFGLIAFSFSATAQNSNYAPPALGEETKGEPAKDIVEKSVDEDVHADEQQSGAPISDSLLGTTKVTESRYENGRLYRIELHHSSGSKQYIEELDSDGKIESTSNDIEETPNLAKWKLGSW